MEHHFGNSRQIAGGSHSALSSLGWDGADAKSGCANEARRALKGNNASAVDDPLFGRKIKW
jgi:hypothetical protein